MKNIFLNILFKMYKCILCCWWTENLSVVIGLIDEVIKNTRIFKWRSILRNIMPHMYLYPKCEIIDNISIYIHYDIIYFHAHVYEGVLLYCGDRIWIENFCFDRQLWQQRKQFRWRPLNSKKMTFQRKRIFNMVSLLFCTYG